ncbi:hypothetical protein BDW66DRAFT_135312 [Aspergillus desertorum]
MPCLYGFGRFPAGLLELLCFPSSLTASPDRFSRSTTPNDFEYILRRLLRLVHVKSPERRLTFSDEPHARAHSLHCNRAVYGESSPMFPK